MSSKQRTTLRQRADQWLGKGNLSRMREVRLGREQVAFVKGKRLWIYAENGDHDKATVIVNLSDKTRGELIDALEGF